MAAVTVPALECQCGAEMRVLEDCSDAVNGKMEGISLCWCPRCRQMLYVWDGGRDS